MKHLINFTEAKALIQRYQVNKNEIETAEFKDSLYFSETFDANAFRLMLDQPGCVKIRQYIGMQEDKKLCAVFVGVNVYDEDMVGTDKGGETDIIIEFGIKCPPVCNNSKFK